MYKAASEKAFRLLKEKKQRVSFAESLTGGRIAAALIENSGASSVIDESYVTYAPESKMHILGVKKETVDTVGVVSYACACEMAEGVRKISHAHWGVSATGLAGPDGGTEDLPVGTVFIGVSSEKATCAYECRFTGDREKVRLQAVKKAFELLSQAIAE